VCVCVCVDRVNPYLGALLWSGAHPCQRVHHGHRWREPAAQQHCLEASAQIRRRPPSTARCLIQRRRRRRRRAQLAVEVGEVPLVELQQMLRRAHTQCATPVRLHPQLLGKNSRDTGKSQPKRAAYKRKRLPYRSGSSNASSECCASSARTCCALSRRALIRCQKAPPPLPPPPPPPPASSLWRWKASPNSLSLLAPRT
jgi:hypothetical protein